MKKKTFIYVIYKAGDRRQALASLSDLFFGSGVIYRERECTFQRSLSDSECGLNETAELRRKALFLILDEE